MSERGFVHLHVHTQYSLLDGAIRVEPLMAQCAEMGMPAVAMTDHGAMYGAVHFQKAAKKAGVKSIIGVDLYMADGDRRDTESRKANHLTLLARNLEGYRNLSTIVSMAWLEGKHPQTGLPRADMELLRENSAGIICLTGDLGGVVNQHLLRGKMDKAERALAELREIFGKEHTFLEIMDAPLPEFKKSREGLIALAQRTGTPLVATNDCHYLTQEDALAHAILMCIQLGKSVDPEQVMVHGLNSLYLRSPQEMWTLFEDVPEACENTLRIADMIDLKIPLGDVFLPTYDVPEVFLKEHGFSEAKEGIDDYFAKVAWDGLEMRFAEMRENGLSYDEEEYKERLKFEIGIIQHMKFPGYFLIVWDFINYAKQIGVPVGPGRGSGAGSLVAYSMEITDIDPMPYGLLFERFLNPERVSMPDFDIDFCMNRRGEVIDYVTQKYGAMNVGQIITYGQLKARACIKDVGRALGMNYGETDRIAKLVPDELKITLQSALDREPRLKEAYDEEPQVKTLFDIALRLENLNRQAGMHAAGIVISEDPLWHTVPVCRGANDELVTQFAKDEVEEAGLVKFDFLGLKTLTVIDTAVKLINEQRKKGAEEDFNIRSIPMDDRGVFDTISRGNTTGIFQLESSGFQSLLQKLKPDVFEDIVAAVALYRPGPLGTGMVDDFIDRKHGRQAIQYPHPWLQEVLAETYGTIVYQEQVMKIAQIMADYTLGGADKLRRAMGKKKAKVMDEQRVIFVNGATNKEVPSEKANEIFDLMAYFAGYGFNKCVVGSTRITHALTGERTTVRELFEERRDFTVHAKGDDGKMRPQPVTDVVWNGRKPVFELRTAQGRTLTATGNHPFWTLQGWTNLEDLQVGDRIASPRHMTVPSKKRWPRHELITLGWLLSEGNTCHPTCLYFYNNRQDAIDDFSEAASHFPQTVARIDKRADGRRMEVCLSTGRDTRFRPGQTPWNASTARDTPAQVAAPTRSGAWRWAEGLGLLNRKAHEKAVPEAIFQLCDEDVACFLGRLWAGDGFFANKTQAVPYYATSSRRLAEDVQDLLLRFGILSGLHKKTFKYRGKERTGYTVHLFGEGSREAFLEHIAPHAVSREADVALLEQYLSKSEGGTSKDTLPKEIRHQVDAARRRAGLNWREVQARAGVSNRSFQGDTWRHKKGFRRGTIAKLGEALKDPALVQEATSELFWDRIVSIAPKGVEDTFDLTVDEDHNFVANGLIVHNSHSAAYALITYQTAYLKVHNKVEFMAALMTCDRENTDKVVRFINEAQGMGIEVMPPDVNESDLDFSVVEGKIRFGLGAIKGVGEGAIESVLEARQKKGAFKSLYDFCERVDLKRVNRRVLEAMIKAGAFDSVGLAKGSKDILALGSSRARMMGATSTAIDRGQKAQQDLNSGQSSLFGMFAAASSKPTEDYYPDCDPWTDKELLAEEKSSIGFYITGHPLDRYEQEVKLYAKNTTLTMRQLRHREEIAIAGVISTLREKSLKSGKGRMAFIDFEDREGSVEVLCFSSAFAEYEEVLKSDEPLLLKGTVSVEGDGDNVSFKIRMTEAVRLVDARMAKVRRVRIALDAGEVQDTHIRRLAEVLQKHPGTCTTELRLQIRTQDASGTSVMVLGEDFKVEPSDDLMIAVERLFGRRVVSLR